MRELLGGYVALRGELTVAVDVFFVNEIMHAGDNFMRCSRAGAIYKVVGSISGDVVD